MKNSASGPNANAGKKLSAPIIRTIKISRNTNIPFVVKSVPAFVAIFFLPARLPTIASVPMIGRKRANSMTRPSETFKNTVFALKPAKAEPLLPPQEEYVYSISEKPCAPLLFRLSATLGTTAASPLPIRIAIGVARQTSTDHFIRFNLFA